MFSQVLASVCEWYRSLRRKLGQCKRLCPVLCEVSCELRQLSGSLQAGPLCSEMCKCEFSFKHSAIGLEQTVKFFSDPGRSSSQMWKLGTRSTRWGKVRQNGDSSFPRMPPKMQGRWTYQLSINFRSGISNLPVHYRQTSGIQSRSIRI